jgi:glycosyltransferase involved in cell wall biosynthesis
MSLTDTAGGASPRRDRLTTTATASAPAASSAASRGRATAAERPLRILYLHRIASNDGQYVHLRELTDALTAAGHKVRLLGPSVEAGEGGNSKAAAAAAWRGRLKAWLPRPVKEGLEIAYNGVVLAKALRVWRREGPFDAIYARHGLFFAAGSAMKRLTGRPLLLEVNSPLTEERAAHGGLTLRALAGWLERREWRAADTVLPVTAVLGRTLAGAGVPARRIEVVPNGVGAAFHEPASGADLRRRLGIGDRVVLGFVGFVRAWHGLDAVVRWLARAAPPEAVLVVAGDGPARPDLERLAAELGVGARVHFLGRVARRDMPCTIAAFDIALQPKVVAYASPLKLAEYMAQEKAVVAPDQPNIREVVDSESSALLIPPGDALALGKALDRLCRDPRLRARLGKAAAARVNERNLSWSANASRVADCIKRLSRVRSG